MCNDYHNLLNILASKNISLNSFAQQTGIPATTISSAAKAGRTMPIERAIKCADALQISPSEICSSLPVIEYDKLPKSHSKVLERYVEAIYVKQTTSSIQSDSADATLQQQINKYQVSSLQALLSIIKSKAEMDDLDQLLRIFVSLNAEGREELLGHAKIVGKHHSLAKRKAKLKGIHRWTTQETATITGNH